MGERERGSEDDAGGGKGKKGRIKEAVERGRKKEGTPLKEE